VDIKRPDDFITLAERGLFVYDWRDIHRTKQQETRSYELVAEPNSPLSISGNLASFMEGVVTMDADFASERTLDVQRYVPCKRAA
jgi:hypothetical protein